MQIVAWIEMILQLILLEFITPVPESKFTETEQLYYKDLDFL